MSVPLRYCLIECKPIRRWAWMPHWVRAILGVI